MRDVFKRWIYCSLMVVLVAKKPAYEMYLIDVLLIISITIMVFLFPTHMRDTYKRVTVTHLRLMAPFKRLMALYLGLMVTH